MPNHTVNTVELKGIGKADLYSFHDNGEKYFDFEKLIPSPKTKEECPDEFIDRGNCNLQHEEGKEWFNWYNWNCRFWGTKWNSYWLKEIDDDTISFTTAWSEPEPIFEALSKRFPENEVVIHADYEEGYKTHSCFVNGKRTLFETEE